MFMSAQWFSVVAGLPEGARSLPSHLLWVEELAQFVEAAAFKDMVNLEEYVKSKLPNGRTPKSEPETEGQEEEGEEMEEAKMDTLTQVARALNRASMFVYVQDLEAAEAELAHLRKSEVKQVSPKHMEVIEYLIGALQCSCSIIRSRWRTLRWWWDTEDQDELWWEEYVRLFQKWEELQSSAEAQAAICFFKAWLCQELSFNEEKTLEYFLEAVKLDPECHLWYHWAYRTKRRIRRNIQRGTGPRGLESPSPEEVALAAKGYELCPTDVITVANYAMVLKETLWTKNKWIWKLKEGTCLRVLELFREALQIAKDQESKHWEMKVTVYLAEFLAFGKGDKLDPEEGRRLLEELAEKQPNTMILHKLGKMYHQGIGGTRDKDKAKACYQEALHRCPSNFGCLMDYLKLLEGQHEFQEMVKVCNAAMQVCGRDAYREKLETRRAEALGRMHHSLRGQERGNSNARTPPAWQTGGRGAYYTPSAADEDDNWRVRK